MNFFKQILLPACQTVLVQIRTDNLYIYMYISQSVGPDLGSNCFEMMTRDWPLARKEVILIFLINAVMLLF